MTVEKDSLRNFDFNEVSEGGGGLFLKFEAGKPVKLRVLTTDPIMNIDNKYGSTRFGFVVYNFTESKAQIMNCSPSIARRISELHGDPDFGGNIRNVDIKITPTGEKLERRYNIDVLPKTETLTNEQIKEAAKIDLEGVIASSAGFSKRLGMYNRDEYNKKREEFNPDRDGDKANVSLYDEEDAGVSIEDLTKDGEPINIDDIPF